MCYFYALLWFELHAMLINEHTYICTCEISEYSSKLAIHICHMHSLSDSCASFKNSIGFPSKSLLPLKHERESRKRYCKLFADVRVGNHAAWCYV